MSYSKRCIVTGGAGFIGSALTRLLLKETEATVLVVDKLTYAGVPENLKEVGLNPGDLSSSNPRLSFLKADICDQEAMDRAFAEFNEFVLVAGELYVESCLFEFFLENFGNGEDDVLLVRPFALGARVLAAVAWVDDDCLYFAGSCGFVFGSLLCRAWRCLFFGGRDFSLVFLLGLGLVLVEYFVRVVFGNPQVPIFKGGVRQKLEGLVVDGCVWNSDGEFRRVFLGDDDEGLLYGEPVERGSDFLGKFLGVDGIYVGKRQSPADNQEKREN